MVPTGAPPPLVFLARRKYSQSWVTSFPHLFTTSTRNFLSVAAGCKILLEDISFLEPFPDKSSFARLGARIVRPRMTPFRQRCPEHIGKNDLPDGSRLKERIRPQDLTTVDMPQPDVDGFSGCAVGKLYKFMPAKCRQHPENDLGDFSSPLSITKQVVGDSFGSVCPVHLPWWLSRGWYRWRL